MLSAIILFAACILPSCSPKAEVEGADVDGVVYVCTGPNSRRYHQDEDCKGLRNCSREVVVLAEDEAIESGKTPCRLCARRRE